MHDITNRRNWLRLALAGAGLAASGLVGGCLPLAATGIAMGGMSLLDRRTVGAQTDDQSIEIKGMAALRKVPGGTSVSVTSFNRKALLTGPVTDEAAQKAVEAALAKIDTVRSVHNETTVGFRPSLSRSTSDSALTARVKAGFVEAHDLQSNAIKVVTEGATVFLMGLVTRREGDRAADVAARVGGVAKVVTVFEYISESELSTMEKAGPDGNKAQATR